MIDLLSLFGFLGYVLIVGSTLPQIYRNFKDRYVGNQQLRFYGVLTAGITLLIPTTFASGRLDLQIGTWANVTSAFLLALSVILFRKNKVPKGASP